MAERDPAAFQKILRMVLFTQETTVHVCVRVCEPQNSLLPSEKPERFCLCQRDGEGCYSALMNPSAFRGGFLLLYAGRSK